MNNPEANQGERVLAGREAVEYLKQKARERDDGGRTYINTEILLGILEHLGEEVDQGLVAFEIGVGFP